jgi:hypothetical protein
MERRLSRLLAIALVVLGALPARAQGMRRFAVVAGNDEGGDGTRPLLYARDDARKIHEILTRLGGIQPGDSELVLNGKAADLLAALGRVEKRIREAAEHSQRTALLFYYSGHSKDGALRLGDTEIPFDSLKSRLAQARADVRIGIFDSCQSGAITRSKGARKAPSFEVESDAGSTAKGLAILASSAADEDSQESDQIGGSYFSHHLASGLLGDADRSGDGRVTLSEAYAYAYARTVADTVESAAGAQHPTYSYDLAGNGDIVLTDVIARKEGILFPAEGPDGAYYLVDSRGFVSAEVIKAASVERRIALAPGTYRVKRRLSDRLRIGEVRVASGQMTVLDEASLRDAPFSADPVKGPGRISQISTHVSLGFTGYYQSFFDSPTRDSLFPPAPMLGLEAQIHNFLRRDWIWGFDLALGGSRSTLNLAGLSLPYRFSELTVGTSILVEWPEGDFVPFLGTRLAMVLMSRQFDDRVVPNQSFYTFSPGLVAGLKFRISRHWGIAARARVHYLLYNIEQDRSLGYWEIATLLTYEM